MATREKVLLTGASGFLGSYVLELTDKEIELHVIQHRSIITWADNIAVHSVDLTQSKELHELLTRIQPDFIIHLAAQSDANYCEQHPDETIKLNVGSTETIARWVAENNAMLFFASSDLIFGGENPPYGEDDDPDPVSEYGRQKVKAENVIRNLTENHLIARLPLMYGEKGSNTLTGMVGNLKAGKNLNLFTDEFRTPAYARDVAEMIWQILKKKTTGTIHLGGPQSISRYKMGEITANAIGANRTQLISRKQAEVKLPAPRPRDVSLNSEKAFSLGYKPKAFENVITQLKEYL